MATVTPGGSEFKVLPNIQQLTTHNAQYTHGIIPLGVAKQG